MASSQFARMPQYHHQPLCTLPSEMLSEHGTCGAHSAPHTLNGITPLEHKEQECIIANGYPMSPVSSPISVVEDSPDTPGIYRTQSFDVAIFDLRRVPPDQIAAQITLIDLQLFKAIRMEELSNCNWTKKEKQRLSPNIVAFTQRFNHTSFLVVRDTLNEENEKVRAEFISQFIKIAKKLYEMNNIHSLKAVVSGLQSTPIYRLSHTWKHVPKKDKSTFEKLEDFLSDNENRKVLREHMDAAKLPCIPHLGLFLTDLCFLHDVPNKGPQAESILNFIAYCQNSTYDTFIIEPHIQKYLNHVRYIDELQKFFEDDNYKLSLKYEPKETPEVVRQKTDFSSSPFPPPRSTEKTLLRTSKSHEDLLTQQALEEAEDRDLESPFSSKHRNSFLRRSLNTGSGKEFAPMKKGKHKLSASGLGSAEEERFSSSLVVERKEKKTTTLPNNFRGMDGLGLSPFIKPRTLSERGDRTGTNFLNGSGEPFSTSLVVPGLPPSGSHKGSPASSGRVKKDTRGHKKSHSLGTNVLSSMFGVSKPSPPEVKKDLSLEPPPTTNALSLLDDSLLDDFISDSIGNASVSGGSSSHCSMEDMEEFSEEDQLCRGRRVEDTDESLEGSYSGANIIKQGNLKRKILKLNGHGYSQLRGRSKCWLELTPHSIVFMEAKSKHGKKQSKPDKTATVSLKDCQLKHRDPSLKLTDEQFIINDDDGNSTKFTAKSAGAAMEWVVAIKEAIREEEERARQEAERSLIKL